jgi:hypothetical protein
VRIGRLMNIARALDVAERLIRRYLPASLALLCAIQFATWAPHYVTWPWWADHDVFATAARSWDAGVIPYRDFRLNNFPGTLYLFWILGRVFGWGATAPLYALDALLVALFGGLLWLWSVKRFGNAIAGAVGYALFLSYYLGLNYSFTAQRDWHAAFCAAAVLIVLECWYTRAAWIAAGTLIAIALSIRPQVVLFAPALAVVLAFRIRDRRPREGRLEPILTIALAASAALVALAYPLVRAGAFGSFITSVTSLVGPGGYGVMSTRAMAWRVTNAVAPLRMLVVPAAIGLVWMRADRVSRRTAVTWLLAYAGALVYLSLGPLDHPYLNHPVMVTWSMLAGTLAEMAWNDRTEGASSLNVALVLLVVASAVTLKPPFADRDRAVAALRLGRHANDSRPPIGYTPGGVLSANPAFNARYDWQEYRAVVEYLTSLPPGVRVANALYGAPALTGPSGRLSALPAESIAWLLVVRRADQPIFADAVKHAADAVVVWSPSEIHRPDILQLPELFSTIRMYYEPDRHFGEIEVWRRREHAIQPEER